MSNILRKISRFQKILAVSEEFFSIVHTQNATGRDMHQRSPRLHCKVYAKLPPGSRPPDNYRLPTISVCR